MEQVKKKIVDTRMLEILKEILEGKGEGKSNIGLAQGGILSRQLSNIVMHIFDEYITNKARESEKEGKEDTKEHTLDRRTI
ncbi:hypothetical protein K3495_g14166 [Podosphaera aphanis]|nr:hypothetical protein K3495_g14166 [Podosphaera aphanis]